MELAHEKAEMFKSKKLEETRKEKEEEMLKEAKKVKKKTLKARRLEMIEAEILLRLRETHNKQKEAIEEIEMMFKQGGASSFAGDSLNMDMFEDSKKKDNTGRKN